jgi:hypothetical protein
LRGTGFAVIAEMMDAERSRIGGAKDPLDPQTNGSAPVSVMLRGAAGFRSADPE